MKTAGDVVETAIGVAAVMAVLVISVAALGFLLFFVLSALWKGALFLVSVGAVVYVIAYLVGYIRAGRRRSV